MDVIGHIHAPVAWLPEIELPVPIGYKAEWVSAGLDVVAKEHILHLPGIEPCRPVTVLCPQEWLIFHFENLQ